MAKNKVATLFLRTSGPSAGLVNSLPWRHFVKQLLGVIDVDCSICWSAGPSAKRGGRSHRVRGARKHCLLPHACLWWCRGGPRFSVCRLTRSSLHHLGIGRWCSDQGLLPPVQILKHRCGRDEVPKECCGEGRRR